MKIHELLAAGFTRSFEFFPPKNDEESAALERTLTTLGRLKPSFVSVTYRGGTSSRQRTFDLVNHIEKDRRLIAMAHLICVGHTENELRDILSNYQANSIENLMALGGDVPNDPLVVRGDFEHAMELVTFARKFGNFSIGVAAHPQGHPRSPDLKSDRDHLAHKLSLADFAVCQFFFDAGEWVTLVGDLAERDVYKPVLPGVIAVTSLSSVARMSTMGSPVPSSLIDRLETAHQRGGPKAVKHEGISAAVEMCEALIDLGAPGLHFYTMNRSDATGQMYEQLFGATKETPS